MNEDIKELLEQLQYAIAHSEESEKARKYYNAITNLENKIEKLKEWLYNYKKQIGTKESIILSDEKVLDSLIEIIEGVNNGFI